MNEINKIFYKSSILDQMEKICSIDKVDNLLHDGKSLNPIIQSERNIEMEAFGRTDLPNHPESHQAVKKEAAHYTSIPPIPRLFVNKAIFPCYKIVVFSVNPESQYNSSSILSACDNSKINLFSPSINACRILLNISSKGQAIKLQIWSGPSQERFAKISNRYLQGAAGIVLLCDLSDGNTLIHLQNKLTFLEDDSRDSVCPILIAGNIDPEKACRISDHSLINFSHINNCKGYIKTCINDGTNCRQVFETLGSVVHDQKVTKATLSNVNTSSQIGESEKEESSSTCQMQ